MRDKQGIIDQRMVLPGHTVEVRIGFVAALLVLISVAFGQSEAEPTGNSFVTPPQVFIIVTKDSMGADLVRVTAMQPDYPPAVLKLQCDLVGKFANGNARGIEVSSRNVGNEGGASMLTATFACNNLIDRTNQRLNVDAIVKGFMGSAKPMISSFIIQFDGEATTPNTIKQFQDKNVILEGKAYKNPDGIEYRVEVLTQDTRAFTIPGSLAELPKGAAQPVATKGLNPIIFPILIGGIIVAGALVYFALVRPGHKARKN